MAHILITNDDGIQAEGLRALVQAMEGVGTISVVAPSHERSASAQSLTLRQPIFWEQVAEHEWSVEGTPTDAVILALHKLLPNRPDLVISGINRGGNLGENVFYLVQLVLAEGMPQGVMLNVNVPLTWNGSVRFTRQSKKVTRNVLQEGTDPRGRSFFWLHEQEQIEGLDPESDYAAVFDGAVSMTPLQLDRTHETSLNHLSHWAPKLESKES